MSAPNATGVPHVLDATNLAVSFGGLRAVVGIDIHVAEGEIVAIVGPNGAGKTTVLNAISGFVPMTGDVSVRGRRPRTVHPRALAQLGLGRSFQTPQLIESESAVTNVMCGAHARSGYASWEQVFRLIKVHRRERVLAEEAREYLRQAHIADRDMDRPVTHLTHGMRKRIDIARALMARPTLLLMDEPTAGMGAEERAIVEEMAKGIRRDLGTAILMVEHHMDVVRAMADRVVAMHTGSVLKAGAPDEVLESDEFVVASLGRAAAGTLHLTSEHLTSETGA
jgi:ABC-type branched-subunit amino acid transport system ATPase component